jgi:hypothetical protein
MNADETLINRGASEMPSTSTINQNRLPTDPSDIIFETDDIKLYIERGNF